MKVEAWIFGILVIFFVVVTPIYWFLSNDPTGTVALILTLFLSLMIAGYLALVARRIDPRPEDRTDGQVLEGAGDLGFFPPQSKWPLFCAADVHPGRARPGLRLVVDDPGLCLRLRHPDRLGLRVLPRRPRALAAFDELSRSSRSASCRQGTKPQNRLGAGSCTERGRPRTAKG